MRQRHALGAALLAASLAGCAGDREHAPLPPALPESHDPAVVYAPHPPAMTTLEFVDPFDASERASLEFALRFVLEAWDRKLAAEPTFLPRPERLHALVEVHRHRFVCGTGDQQVEGAAGCAWPWEGRVEVTAGDALDLPALIHELLHYHLDYPYDYHHEDPRWERWEAWDGEVRRRLSEARQ